MKDFYTYYYQLCLEWISIKDDFADSNRYAGDKNIAHIVEVAKMFDLVRKKTNRFLSAADKR